MIEETVKSPISGYRSLSEEHEHHLKEVKIGDLLPTEYENIVELYEKKKPAKFAELARIVAYYFYSLDTRSSLVDESGNSLATKVQDFADLLAHIPLVGKYYDRFEQTKDKPNSYPDYSLMANRASITRRRVVKLENPHDIFPPWLCDIRESSGFTPWILEEATTHKQFLKGYSLELGIEPTKFNNQLYYDFPTDISPEKSIAVSGIFKAYVDNQATQASLQLVFRQLGEKKIHPHTMKTLEGRLVMYWYCEPHFQLTNKINSSFNSFGVQLRGFAQDTRKIKINSDGTWKLHTEQSNDQALSFGNISKEMKNVTDDPLHFLRLYLEGCHLYARNPIEPTMMAFVRVQNNIIEGESIKNFDELKSILTATKESGTPLVLV